MNGKFLGVVMVVVIRSDNAALSNECKVLQSFGTIE